MAGSDQLVVAPDALSGTLTKRRSPALKYAILLGIIGLWVFFVFPWGWDFQKGAFYMFPLAACSILGWTVILERWLSLQAAEEVDTSRLRADVRDALKRGDVDGAMQICESASGPVADILEAGLRKYKLLSGLGRSPDVVENEVVKAMEDHGVHVVADLERYLPALAAVGNVAPLFGFAGTVSGMMKSFQVIAEKGMEAQLLAIHISEALITTAGGLLIAIPSYIAFNYFTSRVQRFVLDIEQSASEFMEVISIEMSTDDAPAAQVPAKGPKAPPLPPQG